MNRTVLYAYPERTISKQEQKDFSFLVKRRLRREPVAYILGIKEFWSLSFEVTSDVLIPRPATEVLVEETLDVARDQFTGRNPDILEIGTGSGAISIAIASELQNVRIKATDISPSALSVAGCNAMRHGVSDSVIFLEGNLFEPVSGEFDIIVSNPPYIPADVLNDLPPEVRYEPASALLGGSEGTEYHHGIITEGKDFLRPGGYLIMEIGDGQRTAVEDILLADDSYENICFRKDYEGIYRVVRAMKKR
jgi:release factor glutamine methyltransferase